MEQLLVLYKDLKAGVLIKENEGSYVFKYNGEYLNNPLARPISVNLPLQAAEFRSSRLFPFFDSLIAEGWLLDAQSAALKIDRSDRFGLISKCGLDCVGAVSLRGMDE